MLSIQITILAERKQQTGVIVPITLYTYPGYYKKINIDEPITMFYPKSSIPVILIPEQSFTIQFHSIAFDKLTAELTTAYDQIPDTILLIIESISQEE